MEKKPGLGVDAVASGAANLFAFCLPCFAPSADGPPVQNTADPQAYGTAVFSHPPQTAGPPSMHRALDPEHAKKLQEVRGSMRPQHISGDAHHVEERTTPLGNKVQRVYYSSANRAPPPHGSIADLDNEEE